MKNPVSILKPHAIALLLGTTVLAWSSSDLHLTQHDVLETHGLTVLLFHNEYHRVFGDQKMNGMEIILHDQRIATSGDVRLSATPEQWDPIPDFKQRKRGTAPDEVTAVTAFCTYPDRGLSYRIDVQPEAGGFRVAVQLDQAVPAALAGKAGFNLEFLPTLYFGKSYSVDDGAGMFPRHSDGPMEAADGTVEPLPLATGHRLVLSPEDPSTRVTITSDSGPILLFDGRNQAQNGWFVVRTLIPAGKTGDVLVWHVRPNLIPGWTRPPVVGYNQVGYTPEREKVAVVELDPLFDAPKTARVVRLTPEGEYREALSGEIKLWGKWMRYQYAHFDFSSVREPGIYAIEYAGQRTGPFRIAKDVYDGIWLPSLDTYLPEQMDHVKVREGYRIWHGASHLDDARQAPVNYTHFDGYKQGPTTDSPFTPGQHIPGINVGGWYDAGDFDLRTQTQTRVITDLVQAREQFGVNSDDTSVDETAGYVQLRKPDGVPDVVQQIEHGVILLLAEHHAIGHAISGIIEPTLEEYTHLGDAASKTDERIYSEHMGPLETDGIHSGVPDDRWAFTTHTTALSYDEVGALAAASRVLRGFNDKMADECLQTAVRVWDEERRTQAGPGAVSLFQHYGERSAAGRNRGCGRAADFNPWRSDLRKTSEGTPAGDQRSVCIPGRNCRACHTVHGSGIQRRNRFRAGRLYAQVTGDAREESLGRTDFYGYLGRVWRGYRVRIRDVFVAPGVSRKYWAGVHTRRAGLRAGAAPGLECFVCVDRRNTVKAHCLRE